MQTPAIAAPAPKPQVATNPARKSPVKTEVTRLTVLARTDAQKNVGDKAALGSGGSFSVFEGSPGLAWISNGIALGRGRSGGEIDWNAAWSAGLPRESAATKARKEQKLQILNVQIAGDAPSDGDFLALGEARTRMGDEKQTPWRDVMAVYAWSKGAWQRSTELTMFGGMAKGTMWRPFEHDRRVMLVPDLGSNDGMGPPKPYDMAGCAKAGAFWWSVGHSDSTLRKAADRIKLPADFCAQGFTTNSKGAEFVVGFGADGTLRVLSLQDGRVASSRRGECAAWQPMPTAWWISEKDPVTNAWSSNKLDLSATCIRQQNGTWYRSEGRKSFDTVAMQFLDEDQTFASVMGGIGVGSLSSHYVESGHRVLGRGREVDVHDGRSPALVGCVAKNGWGVARSHLWYTEYEDANEGNLLFFAGDAAWNGAAVSMPFSGVKGLDAAAVKAVSFEAERSAYKTWANKHGVEVRP